MINSATIKSLVKESFPALVLCKRKVVKFAVRLKLLFESALTQHRIIAGVKRLKTLDKVRVAFFVTTSAEFQLELVYRRMLKDSRFQPFIVVIPVIGWPGLNPIEKLHTEYDIFSKKYGDRVISSWDGAKYIDVSKRFDLILTENTYDHLTDNNYRIETLARRGLPIVLANYFYYNGTKVSDHIAAKRGLSFLWRYYAENVSWARKIEHRNLCLALRRGVRISGYPKFDISMEASVDAHTRKRVLICPHHSVTSTADMQIGNFLKYSELFLELPRRYPQIEWVFRPHPLLPSALVANGLWDERQWDDYIARFTVCSNAVYLPTGPYYELFANSDAMIQDCGSFLPEYICTGKPQCYMVRSESHMRAQFNKWGLKLLSQTYVAMTEEDILSFVDHVVVEGKDKCAVDRIKFADEHIRINYPNVSEWIFNDLCKAMKQTVHD